jgi:uncharacterized membrane protein
MKTIVKEEILLLGACFLFLTTRILYSGQFGFVFLIWNLWLSYLPYWFINRCIRSTQPWKQLLFVSLSILFLPNAPYIVTDLFHLGKTTAMPLWFDLLLIVTFALAGLYYFVKSLKRILMFLQTFPFVHKHIYVIKVALLIACGYGIYLGRFLRFNSWDAVTHPFYLIKTIFTSLFHPSHYKETWAITIAFTLFLFLVYELSLNEKKKND